MRRRNAARKRRLRTVVGASVAVAGAAGLVAGSLYAGHTGEGAQAAKLAGDAQARRAQAGGARASSAQPRAAALAARLAGRLGGRTAGGYLDAAGRPVVTVATAADAAMVRSAGAVPKMMRTSPRTLARTTAALRRSMAGTPGTGWAVDPATSQVVMWVDDSVKGARMAGVRRAAAGMGTAVRMVRLPGRLHTLALGGDAIFGGGARCSLGFNVERGGQPFFLTAGHCGNIVKDWTADQAGAQALGTTVQSDFPGNDFALVQATDDGQSAVDLHDGTAQPIAKAADAVVGQQVARSGSTTGVHTGRVTAVGATVNFPEGTVTGMIQTTVCAEPGDSGGPLFSGKTALGLTSGGSGDCQTGGVTFFQPVTEALQTFGAQIP
ncbi:trypsin-like serine protease [Actinomadura sp. LD22]|uniref:Trypsin-like serine protease n=1 Tax=Actinomadura physcomitrii TaxID=2650748 RepID=A0A6I4MAW9_9ACTN|nr:trypsin-like serine protease [Actinomadura physcomitrii]